MIVPKQDEQIRLWVDLQAANTAIKRVCHPIPKVRDISLDLNADDIIIVGSNYEERNKALEECLLRLETHTLISNMGKCKFLKQNLQFFGMIFSTESVRPDPKKISAFVNTATSSTVSEVRSLIGMANHSSQFIPNLQQ